MNQKQSKTAYFILILLIILAIAVIGGLIMVLFNTEVPAEKEVIAPHHSPLPTNTFEQITPVSEKIIEVEAEDIPPAKEAAPKSTASITPSICKGCGPQIRSRDAYKNPATYTANVQPNHVRFTIYAERKINSK
jgi:Na+-transporting methylmalonyl-CoA/oxaloacetate decarboxylase gamma subunit